MLKRLQKAAPADRAPDDVRHLELLAHYDLKRAVAGADPVRGASADSRSGFALILELTDRELLVEGDIPFGPGDRLSLDFFLPDLGADSGRTKVTLECVLTQCLDEAGLQYGARISQIGDTSKRAIQAINDRRGDTASSPKEQP